MKRSRSVSRIQADMPQIEAIIAIKGDHPLWGYRRVWAYMRYRQGVIVGRNRIYRLMKENRLLIHKRSRFLARRKPERPKPRASYPNKYWGTDMTKIKIGSFGWVYLHIVLDWYTKELIGYSFSFQSKTDDWLDALNMAVNARFPNGIRESKRRPQLISDNGCQPTSERYMRSCSELEIKQVFTSWNNPKGNADTERVIRTIKEDLVWPYDWENPFIFEEALKSWIDHYNTDFPHQSLKYKTPTQFYHHYLKQSQKTEVLST
jgi:transposase InsO family protein